MFILIIIIILLVIAHRLHKGNKMAKKAYKATHQAGLEKANNDLDNINKRLEKVLEDMKKGKK